MKRREEKEVIFQPYFYFGPSERREYFNSEGKKIKNIIFFLVKKSKFKWLLWKR